jgi:hypothetical protein
MKRFFIIVLFATVVHVCLTLALASLAASRAERERFEGNLPAHAVFQAMGVTAQVLMHPLMWLRRGYVCAPRTTIFFATNSFLWGLAIATLCVLITRHVRAAK